LLLLEAVFLVASLLITGCWNSYSSGISAKLSSAILLLNIPGRSGLAVGREAHHESWLLIWCCAWPFLWTFRKWVGQNPVFSDWNYKAGI